MVQIRRKMSNKVYCCAEIGINHNASVEIAKQLIEEAADAGFDAVKFQKRTIDVVYSKEELDKYRESPWGTTNRQQKEALEFNYDQYAAIVDHCKRCNVDFFASCWDEKSVDFIEQFAPRYYKIASASLTDDNLLRHTADKGRELIVSTGMSTLEEVDHALEVINRPVTLMQCTSSYPCDTAELNLRVIQSLRHRYDMPVGYSGHEKSLAPTLAAVALGATMIERHITLDRTMYGSDQAASLEVAGFRRLIRDIREVEKALGDGTKRVYDSEIPCKDKLRRK